MTDLHARAHSVPDSNDRISANSATERLRAFLKADTGFPHYCAGEGCAVCRWQDGERWGINVGPWNAQVTQWGNFQPCECGWCRIQARRALSV